MHKNIVLSSLILAILGVAIPAIAMSSTGDNAKEVIVTIASNGTNGEAVVNPDKTITYTPDANYNGPDSFTYQIDDGNGGLDTATVNVTVNSVNDAPEARDDNFSGFDNASITGNVLADNGVDSDVENDLLTVTPQILTTVQGGSVTIQSNGDFTYDAPLGFSGVDSFDYVLNDSNSGQDIGTVTLNIQSVAISGTSGDDVLNGTSGDDIILGLEGNDTITGGLGDDTMVGGSGNDTFVFNDLSEITANTDHITDFSIDDQIDISAITGLTFIGDNNFSNTIGEMRYVFENSSTAIEIDSTGNGVRDHRIVLDNGLFNLQESAGILTIASTVINGTSGDDVLNGAAGNDIVTGFEGDDTINGFEGNDIYYYDLGDGNDVVTDIGGADKVILGSAINLDNFNSFNDGFGNLVLEVYDSQSGTTTSMIITNYFSAGGNNIIETVEFAVGGLNITGTNASETLTGTGFFDYIRGRDGDDTINGGLGDDRLRGDDGNDIINGEEGDDRLEGRTGDDTLTGGLGDDTLEGRNGNDTYIYNIGDGDDTIIDTSGTDQILLGSTIDLTNFNSFRGGDDLFLQINNPDQSSSTITVSDYFNGNIVETIQFFEGGLNVTGTNGNDSLNGTGFFDYIRGRDGNDVINGGAGDDRLRGDDGDDAIFGDDGDDRLEGRDGDDRLEGGAGSDNYRYSLGEGADLIEEFSGSNDVIILGSGITQGDVTITETGVYDLEITFAGSPNDKIVIKDHRDPNDTKQVEKLIFGDGSEIDLTTYVLNTIEGTNSNNTETGTSGNDIIDAMGGHDTVNAGAGDDVIIGGTGNDTLNGEDGDDTFLINGTGDGIDRINGGAGTDTIIGGSGNDTLRGEDGDDTFLINGTGDGIDRIYGGAGNDTILSSAGDDNIQLSRFETGDSVETIDGGAGVNTISGSNSNNVLDFSNTTLINIDNIDGGNGHDTITGSAGNDTIIGGSGNDTLRGEDGDDTFLVSGVGDGIDRIYGGTGNDTILGSDGIDNIQLSRFEVGDSVEVIDGGLGTNSISGSNSNNVLDFSNTTLINIDHIDGGNGHDTITGSAGNDTIIGGAGNDTMRGGLGDDIFMVGGTTGGIDRIYGEAGTRHYFRWCRR